MITQDQEVRSFGCWKGCKYGSKKENNFKITIFLLFSAFLFLFHIWFRTKVTHLSFEVGKIRKEYKVAEAQLVELKVERQRTFSHKKMEDLVTKWKNNGEVFEAPNKSNVFFIKAEGDQ